MTAKQIESLTIAWLVFLVLLIYWAVKYHPEWIFWIFTFKG